MAVYAEIGGSQEEECAEVIASGKITKPFVVYVSDVYKRQGNTENICSVYMFPVILLQGVIRVL